MMLVCESIRTCTSAQVLKAKIYLNFFFLTAKIQGKVSVHDACAREH